MNFKFIFRISILRWFGIQAITLYPYVLFAGPASEVSACLFRHELQHLYQVQEIGWLRFYCSYLRFYFQLRFQGQNHRSAYLNIPYEIEARQKESNPLTQAELALFQGKIQV